jgi:hypothetical protein
MCGVGLEVDALRPAKAEVSAACGAADTLRAGLVVCASEPASSAVIVVRLGVDAASTAKGESCCAKRRTLAVDALFGCKASGVACATMGIVAFQADANARA